MKNELSVMDGIYDGLSGKELSERILDVYRKVRDTLTSLTGSDSPIGRPTHQAYRSLSRFNYLYKMELLTIESASYDESGTLSVTYRSRMPGDPDTLDLPCFGKGIEECCRNITASVLFECIITGDLRIRSLSENIMRESEAIRRYEEAKAMVLSRSKEVLGSDIMEKILGNDINE